MNILILMIPMALIFAGLFVYAFFWAASNGQFYDTDTPALRMLNDEQNDKRKTIKATGGNSEYQK